MGVTEFTIIPLKSADLGADTKAVLEEVQTIQDKYVQEKFGYSADRTARGSAIFQQVEDPSLLLLATQWPSIEKHGEWYTSAENQSVQAKSNDIFDFGKPVVNFHVNNELFTDFKAPQKSVLEAPVLSVGRMGVPADKKSAFEEGFVKVVSGNAAAIEQHAGQYPLRGGWKAENNSDEFVITGGWESLEAHGAASTAAEWKDLEGTVTSWNFTHYKRVL